MASSDGARPEPRGLQRRGILVEPRAVRVANQARRVHQDLAASLVRVEARKAPLVQGLSRDKVLESTRRGPSGHVPDGEGSRGCPPQALCLRAVFESRHDVLHR